jgi:hypothetical protein
MPRATFALTPVLVAGVLAVILALSASGCQGQGASADLGASACPATPSDVSPCPVSATPFDCTYPDQVCSCVSGSWYCRPLACPSAAVAHAGGACSTGGLQCDYGFEDTCGCVAPEHQWLCCGGTPSCPSALVEGAPCCGGGLNVPGCASACDHGARQVCSCTNLHLHCAAQPCSDGGV